MSATSTPQSKAKAKFKSSVPIVMQSNRHTLPDDIKALLKIGHDKTVHSNSVALAMAIAAPREDSEEQRLKDWAQGVRGQPLNMMPVFELTARLLGYLDELDEKDNVDIDSWCMPEHITAILTCEYHIFFLNHKTNHQFHPCLAHWVNTAARLQAPTHIPIMWQARLKIIKLALTPLSSEDGIKEWDTRVHGANWSPKDLLQALRLREQLGKEFERIDLKPFVILMEKQGLLSTDAAKAYLEEGARTDGAVGKEGAEKDVVKGKEPADDDGDLLNRKERANDDDVVDGKEGANGNGIIHDAVTADDDGVLEANGEGDSVPAVSDHGEISDKAEESIFGRSLPGKIDVTAQRDVLKDLLERATRSVQHSRSTSSTTIKSPTIVTDQASSSLAADKGKSPMQPSPFPITSRSSLDSIRRASEIDPWETCHSLSRLPVDLPSLELLTSVIASSDLGLELPTLTREYIQHALRLIERMGSDQNTMSPESSFLEDYSTNASANVEYEHQDLPKGRHEQVRALKLLVMFIKNLLRKGMLPVQEVMLDLEGMVVRWMWVPEVRELRTVLEGGDILEGGGGDIKSAGG